MFYTYRMNRQTAYIAQDGSLHGEMELYAKSNSQVATFADHMQDAVNADPNTLVLVWKPSRGKAAEWWLFTLDILMEKQRLLFGDSGDTISLTKKLITELVSRRRTPSPGSQGFALFPN